MNSPKNHYELPAVAGEDWSIEDVGLVASLPKNADPREFLIPFGLTQPGTSASFSVFVILTSGGERGSAPMTVIRPA